MSSEALRLADELDSWAKDYATTDYTDAMAVQSASLLRTQAARIAELEAEVERLRGDSVPLGAIRALVVEAIRDVTGCPDIANGDKCITDTIEHIAQRATYRAIEAAKDAP